MEGKRKIPVKNYVILGIVVVVAILILYYFYMWVDVYKESKMNMPILDKYMSVINYNELDNYLVENRDAVIYVSVLEDERIREFEKLVKNGFKSKEIDGDMLYMNVTDEIRDKVAYNEMASLYGVQGVSMVNVPCVLAFRNGELSSIYSVSENDYDVEKFISYLNDRLRG